MDLKELLNAHRYYAVKDDDKEITFYFELRDATSTENLEYRRRLSKVAFKNGKLESSADALNAALWLLDKIKVKVEYSNGTAERAEVPDDLFHEIPEMTRFWAINRYLKATEGEEVEIQKN